MAIEDLKPSSVPAELNYFSPPADGSKPWTDIDGDPETGIRARNYVLKTLEVEIENVRGKQDHFSLDASGFQYFSIPSVMRGVDFGDEQKITETYYPEQIEVIKKLTGANRVVFFDHTIRRHQPGVKLDTPTNRHPAQRVHVDQTPSSARSRVTRHIPDEADSLLAPGKRFQIINLWRPIRVPAFDYPLALCEHSSVQDGDLVSTDLRYKTRDPGEVQSVKYNAGHRWKYLRGMTPDEGVLIKCYDSIEDGSVAVFTPHTAFQDPTTPPDAPLRESIELRALVFYE